MSQDLKQTQIEMEHEARGLGIERYKREVERDQISTPPGRRLLNKCVSRMIPVMDNFIKDALAGTPGRNTGLIYMMEQFDSDLACLVTSTRVLQCLGAGDGAHALLTVSRAIGEILEDQVNYDSLAATNPKLYRQLTRKMAKMGNEGYKHIVLLKAGKAAQIKRIKWGLSERYRLGATMVELFLDANEDVATLETRPIWRKGMTQTETVIEPTGEVEEWMRTAHSRQEALFPPFFPMVVEPAPWSNPISGGYLTQGMQQPLVRTSNMNYLRELEGYDLSKVYDSLNALQSTAWTINTGVMHTATAIWDLGGGRAGMPPREDKDLPAKTLDTTTDEGLAKWKRRAAEVYAENTKLASRRRAISMELSVAGRMMEFDQFWFPHSLDWRGRVYAFGSALNPQGHDLSKGLLQFANGKPLGEGGTFWLAVHGANCYGIDKVSFDDRVQWVLDNEDGIVASAIDPLVNTMWITADGSKKAWQFLAFCKEWAGLKMWTQAGRPQEEYVSHLPVGLDGSCNGLQNFSMAARDEIGGAATNLVPSEKPSDIYQLVANEANRIVECDAIAGVKYHNKDTGLDLAVARHWNGKVTRKLAKQPTMTMPYGSGRFGFKDQLLIACKKNEKETGVDLLDSTEPMDRFLKCQYLAGVLDQAIGKTVVKAREVMDWLQVVAEVAASDGLPVSWTAPSGLPVSQSYKDQIGQRLDFTVLGRRINMTLSVEGRKLNKRKQRQGIAPNFVHSLDAAHLMRSVEYAKAQGVTSFAMVHDSYGTHAGDVDVLAYELRRAFVDQYTNIDVLRKFRDEIRGQLTSQELKDRIPELPTYGSLDPQAVLESEYFFA